MIYQYQKFELPIKENAKVMLIWHPIIVHIAEIHQNEFDSMIEIWALIKYKDVFFSIGNSMLELRRSVIRSSYHHNGVSYTPQ